jgi:hypothetical protein
MGMQNPAVSEPLDKLSDKYPEGTPFFLEAIRTVEANTANYGKGEMVVVRVRGNDRELGVWGSYLLTQAKSVDNSDLNQWYKVERKIVPGFGKNGNAVKVFSVTSEPTPAAA